MRFEKCTAFRLLGAALGVRLEFSGSELTVELGVMPHAGGVFVPPLLEGTESSVVSLHGERVLFMRDSASEVAASKKVRQILDGVVGRDGEADFEISEWTFDELEDSLNRASDGPSLVIAPASVCGNWRTELNRFAPSLRVLMGWEFDPDEKRPFSSLGADDVIVTSYGMAVTRKAAFASREWNGLVLDEAQAIKNDVSKRAHAVKSFRAGFRVVATGTPVENLGILQEWYDFKDKALEELAEERLRDYGIEFKDGKIVCTKPENVTVFECETDEDMPDESEGFCCC